MGKIKITEEQATLIKRLSEDLSDRDSPLHTSKNRIPSNMVDANFKRYSESDIREDIIVDGLDFAIQCANAIKEILTDPSQEGLSPFWIRLGMSRGDVLNLMAHTGLITFTGIKLYTKLNQSEFLSKAKKFFGLVQKKAKEQAENKFREPQNEMDGDMIIDEDDIDETTSMGGGAAGLDAGVYGTDGPPRIPLGSEIDDYVDDEVPTVYETTDSAQVGGESGTFAYDAPVGDGDDFWTAGNKLNKKKGKKVTKKQLEEDAKTQTQWENGSFVKVKEKCKKFPYCDQGPDAIETQKTETAVISDDVFETIAKKTGRSINEVKKLINNYNNRG